MARWTILRPRSFRNSYGPKSVCARTCTARRQPCSEKWLSANAWNARPSAPSISRCRAAVLRYRSAHEIRNPLAALFLHVDLLEEELQQPTPESATQVTQVLAEIRMNLARLEDLVQDYLTLVRTSQLERTPQDLGAALHAWAAEWQQLATNQGVLLRLENLEDLGTVALHASTLRRAMLNLVQNA